MAVVYRILVRAPDTCATRPGVGEVSWSTETHSPGFVAIDLTSSMSDGFDLQALFFAFPYRHAVHSGTAQLASLLGSMPLFAIA